MPPIPPPALGHARPAAANLVGSIAAFAGSLRICRVRVIRSCRALAGALARQLRAKGEAESFRLRGIEDEIVRLLSREGSVEKALSNHLLEVSGMLDADSVAVLQSSELVVSGVCPPEPEIRALAAWIVARPADGVFATDHLADLYRQLGG